MSASMQELIVNCLCVGAGGCVGAIARYLMGLAIPVHQSGFPLGTFAVNVIGAFAIAFIAMALKKVTYNFLRTLTAG